MLTPATASYRRNFGALVTGGIVTLLLQVLDIVFQIGDALLYQGDDAGRGRLRASVALGDGDEGGHHFQMAAFCVGAFLPAQAFSFGAVVRALAVGGGLVLGAFTAAVAAFEVIGQQLRHPQHGQHNRDVGGPFQVL